MNKNVSLVVTSISKPNKILKQLANGCRRHDLDFILVGDRKSPATFSLPGCEFFGIETQKRSGFTFAEKCPENHYARKNLGYLLAMQRGAQIIIETDDDNIPLNSFWRDRRRKIKGYNLPQAGWVNIYKYFSNKNIWPRGLPLDTIKNKIPDDGQQKTGSWVCPIQQGLADENPDVDAIYRLILPLPQSFKQRGKIVLSNRSWCPFNSQNTTWFKEAFVLMYLPSYCSFRMTDIWRSFIAQRIAWTNNWGILYHAPTVIQERNLHNLVKDFNDEIPGYLHNRKICQNLQDLNLKQGTNYLADNLMVCYEELVRNSFLAKEEMPLLKSWITDFKSIDS